jgi:methylglutaconyl-CoA hydratase
MNQAAVLSRVDELGRATLTLNRPRIHNAFDDQLVARLSEALRLLETDQAVRVVLLTGAGKNFCAGADLGWMRRTADFSLEENLADAGALAELFRLLHGLKKPTIAVVRGAAYGGGVGLVSCCDIAVAATGASFCLSETRLGLIPSIISPYLVPAIGFRAAQRYCLSAEPFDAAEAHRLGLIHEVADDPEAVADRISRALLKCAPNALAAAKAQVARVAHAELNRELIEDSVQRIAALRASAEGKEGLSAFLEKRAPGWVKV